MKFGIVGCGRFGKLWADAFLPFGTVMVYDKKTRSEIQTNTSIQMVTLQEVAQADIIFLLVPIAEFETSCQQIKSVINPDSLVVDCCSVKVFPVRIMQEIFTESQPLLGTHPLFGPDSVSRTGGMKGHKIVVSPIFLLGEKQKQLIEIFKKMELSILITTPEEHDKQMAHSQGLVHFIGRGLAALDLQSQDIATPDFQALLSINQMVVNDSWRLFLDMHQYNTYTKNVRKKFMHQLVQLDQVIEDESTKKA